MSDSSCSSRVVSLVMNILAVCTSLKKCSAVPCMANCSSDVLSITSPDTFCADSWNLRLRALAPDLRLPIQIQFQLIPISFHKAASWLLGFTAPIWTFWTWNEFTDRILLIVSPILAYLPQRSPLPAEVGRQHLPVSWQLIELWHAFANHSRLDFGSGDNHKSTDHWFQSVGKRKVSDWIRNG